MLEQLSFSGWILLGTYAITPLVYSMYLISKYNFLKEDCDELNDFGNVIIFFIRSNYSLKNRYFSRIIFPVFVRGGNGKKVNLWLILFYGLIALFCLIVSLK